MEILHGHVYFLMMRDVMEMRSYTFYHILLYNKNFKGFVQANLCILKVGNTQLKFSRDARYLKSRARIYA